MAQYHVDIPQQDERQQELEDMSRFWGQRRLNRRVERDGVRVGAGKTLLQKAVGRTIFVLEEWLEDRKGRRGPKPTMYRWVKRVGAETASFIACQVALKAVNGELLIPDAARSVSHRILHELKARRFRELAPRLFEYRMKSFNTTSYAHMARSVAGTAQKAVCEECWQADREECPHMDFSDLTMGDGERELVGVQLLDIVTEALPGWFERKNVRTSTAGRTRPVELAYLTLTEEGREWVDERNADLGDLAPVFLPMVLPPLPWGPNAPGGYRHALRGVRDLVRGSRKQIQMVHDQASPRLYQAVNRLQETPWRINHRVLEVMEQLEERGGDIAGIPRTEPFEMDHRLGDNPSPEEVQEWKREAGKMKNMEADRQSMISEYADFKRVVALVRDEEAFWFPWNLDFRGRAYPIPAHLNPQGSDRAKGLLEFADPQPLGDRGAFWLAVHGANCLDEFQGLKFSKMTLEDRSGWVHRHSQEIRAVAEDPMSNSWWLEAEDPFQFLAFCFEWVGYLENGEDHESRLPVHIDGSCNGLQHFSALLRDPKGAEAVNVAPNETPQDVYTEVAEAVKRRLVEDAGKGNGLAQAWLGTGAVDRKLAKRPTMTFGYGSKKFGFVNQIWEHLQGLDNVEEVLSWFQDEDGESTVGPSLRYMAECLWDALQDVVVGAFEAMEWMQEMARRVSGTDRPVSWTVPFTGFPVIQDGFTYFKTTEKRLDTHLCGGVRYQPVYQARTKEVDKRRQANGISPNFVHSLDAVAMMLTTELAAQEGLEHFAMIHDSFGCHAGQMEVLRDCTRRAFYQLYSRRDILQDLYHELLDQVDLGTMQEMDPPPEPGTFDIALVLGSDFFFA